MTPNVSNDVIEMSNLTVRIPDDLSILMAQVAVDTNRSLSAVYRVAIRNYIASRYNDDGIIDVDFYVLGEMPQGITVSLVKPSEVA